VPQKQEALYKPCGFLRRKPEAQNEVTKFAVFYEGNQKLRTPVRMFAVFFPV